MGTPEETVKTHLIRAQTALRRSLEAQDERFLRLIWEAFS